LDGIIEAKPSPRAGAAEKQIPIESEYSEEKHVQAFFFTSAPIVKGLLSARIRGVKTEVLLDKNQRTEKKYSSADLLANSGISTRVDGHHAIAQNKVMVIDGETVIQGLSISPRLPRKTTLRICS